MTVRTKAALEALFVDNTTGDIGAQDHLDFIDSIYSGRPLYNVIDSGVAYSPLSAPVDMSAKLDQALVDAGERELWIPSVTSSDEASIYVSEMFKIVHGIRGNVTGRSANAVQSRIRSIPTGFSGTGVISLEDASDFFTVDKMAIYGRSDIPIAAISNSMDTGNNGTVFGRFSQNVLYGQGDTYVVNLPDPGPDNQVLNSFWYENWVLGVSGCKMLLSNTVQDAGESTWLNTWWNFSTAECSASPWKIAGTSVQIYNSFCDLGGMSLPASGASTLFSLFQNTLRIEGFAFESIAGVPSSNVDYMFGIQAGGDYHIEGINSITGVRGVVNFKALVAITLASSDTFLRLDGIDWTNKAWRDGAAAVEVTQTIAAGHGKLSLHVGGLPHNIEHRHIIKASNNQASSASTADPDRVQQAFVHGLHKGRKAEYEIWMDEGTGVQKFEPSGMLSVAGFDVLSATAATKSWRAPYAGHVQALHLILNHDMAGGDLTVTLSIDGDNCDTVLTVDSADNAGDMSVLRPVELNSASFKDGSKITITAGGSNTTNPSTADIDLEICRSVDESPLSLRWRGTHQSLWAERGPKLTFARSSVAIAPDDDGYWHSFASGAAAWYYANHRWGLLLEPAATNLVGSIASAATRDLTNVNWVKTNCTAAKTSDGIIRNSFDAVIANSASTLTATGANATCFLTTSVASGYHVSSAFVRRVTGTGTVEFTDDGGSNYSAIDLTTSDWEVNGDNSGWIRKFNDRTQANPKIGFRIVTSGDVIEVDFAQVETSLVSSHADGTPYPTSPHETTRAKATCSIDRDAGAWWNDARGMLQIQYSVFGDGKRETGTRYLLFGATTANSQFIATHGAADSNVYPRVIMGDSSSDDTFTNATTQKVASLNSTPRFDDVDNNGLGLSWTTGLSRAALNGVVSSPDGGTGYVDPGSWTELYIGGDSSGNNGGAMVLQELAFMPDGWHSSADSTQTAGWSSQRWV